MRNNNCIRNLLKLLCLLQDNSLNKCSLDDGCIKPFLGPTINNICYNTRVLTLYKKDGTIFSTNYTNTNNELISSNYFRVNSINDDCATLLILENNDGIYSSTKQFITINLRCICAVKCINDVVVDNL